MTVAEASLLAREILSASPLAPVHDTPNLDVSLILAHFLKTSRSRLMAHPETALGDCEPAFFEAIRKRAEGLPVAYITGVKEFWGLPFHVTVDVLIPKPDTEILVERAIAVIGELERRRAAEPSQTAFAAPVRVIDVCTGSGCIAVSLKASCPRIDITATDISEAALAVARENARTLLGDAAASPGAASPITFIRGDLRGGLPLPGAEAPARGTAGERRDIPLTDRAGRPVVSAETGETDDHAPSTPLFYDLVVSNPPYVPSAIAGDLLSDGRNEPALALDGGADGLDLVRALVDNVTGVLRPGGTLLVETGEYNARAAAEYLREKGFRDVAILRDLENQERVVEGKRA